MSTLKFSLKLCRKYQNVQPYLAFSLILQISLPRFYLQLLKQSDIIEIKYAIFCLSGEPNLLKFTGSIQHVRDAKSFKFPRFFLTDIHSIQVNTLFL